MSEILSAYPAIRLSDVSRVYKLPRRQERVAVDHISLEVPCGGVFGFLGANGAGKTTTIKMLMGFLSPTSGKLQIFGKPCSDHNTRRSVGYLPEQPYFHPFLSPDEALRIHAEIIGLPRKLAREQIDEVIEITRLTKNRALPLSKLSKGNQQRVGIAQALLGNPQLLIMDEPTSGLDPIGRHEVREVISRLRDDGRTVFLSSHVLSEIDTLCDRVAVLNQGRLVATGSPDEIKRGSDGYTIRVSHFTPAAIQSLREAGAVVESDVESYLECDAKILFKVLDCIGQHGLTLVSVAPAQESLEAAFLRLAA